MTVAEMLRRKRKITMTTSIRVKRRVNFTSATEARIDSERSLSTLSLTVGGSKRWNSGIAAWIASVMFLASYTVYHAFAGSKPFPAHGPARLIYFVILISHVFLAAAVLPFSVATQGSEPHPPWRHAAYERIRDLTAEGHSTGGN